MYEGLQCVYCLWWLYISICLSDYVERVLAKDMAIVGEYLQTWKLKLSTTKMVSAAFHLNNKEAKRDLKVNCNKETLPFCSEPKYLGVTLDRSLTYHRHLESLRKKLTSHVALLRRLAGSGWGAGATTLQIATLALVHWTAVHCTPAWCAVFILALTNWSSPTPCKVWLDTCAIHQRTTLPSSQASNLLSFVAMEPHCL